MWVYPYCVKNTAAGIFTLANSSVQQVGNGNWAAMYYAQEREHLAHHCRSIRDREEGKGDERLPNYCCRRSSALSMSSALFRMTVSGVRRNTALTPPARIWGPGNWGSQHHTRRSSQPHRLSVWTHSPGGRSVRFLPYVPKIAFLQRPAMLALQALYWLWLFCPSVRPSVHLSHAAIVSKRLHVARCSLHCQIEKCV